MCHDLNNVPWAEFGDEQDRADWFESAAHEWRARALELEAASKPTDNERHAAFGRRAMEAGTPDYGKNGEDFQGMMTDASDTVANILHAVHAAYPDNLRRGNQMPDVIFRQARMHYEGELEF